MHNYSNRTLHLVAMDVPSPPDYGGVIDVYYKVKALHQLGVAIHLHCFQYGRPESKDLEQYCSSVTYYPRQTGWKGLSLKYPYMMYSRRSATLLQNLLNDDSPILLEGVHCAYYLQHPSLKGRRILMRNQNIEADYFYQLQFRTTHPLKKLYYKIEARLLAHIERKLDAAYAFLTVAEADHLHFKQLYPEHIHAYIPSFTEVKDLDQLPLGLGKHILYQGNLGHPENEEAALYIIKQIANACPSLPFVLAGKAPSPTLLAAAAPYTNVQIIADPSQDKMEALIHEAQIHLLLTFQATGLKLKLLAAYQNGRHIIANDSMLLGTNLNSVCTTANTSDEIINALLDLFHKPFTKEDSNKRKQIHQALYDPLRNAQKIIDLAFS